MGLPVADWSARRPGDRLYVGHQPYGTRAWHWPVCGRLGTGGCYGHSLPKPCSLGGDGLVLQRTIIVPYAAEKSLVRKRSDIMAPGKSCPEPVAADDGSANPAGMKLSALRSAVQSSSADTTISGMDA